jgi:hypothetical protein
MFTTSSKHKDKSRDKDRDREKDRDRDRKPESGSVSSSPEKPRTILEVKPEPISPVKTLETAPAPFAKIEGDEDSDEDVPLVSQVSTPFTIDYAQLCVRIKWLNVVFSVRRRKSVRPVVLFVLISARNF